MELTFNYVLSQVLTILMYATLVITYYLKDRRKIIFINCFGLLLIGGAFVLLSAYTGVAMTIVAIIRNFIFLFDEEKNGKSEKITRKDVIILIIVYILTIIATIPSYNGFLSLLSVLATSVYTLSVWQKKTIIYKILGIPIGILWISYNIYIMSIFGIVFESILLVAAIGGFVLEWKKGNKINN